MDNASNNDTFMRELEELLGREGYGFDENGNRVRYWESFSKLLRSGLLGRARGIITSLRSSGNRREALQRLIAEGNARIVAREGDAAKTAEDIKNGWWTVPLPKLELCRDCPTRWSSTFLMLDRFLTLLPAILKLCKEYGIEKSDFTPEELHILYQYRDILSTAHHAQELLCSERTPTLSMALPLYEMLITSWTEHKKDVPELSHIIDIGLAKLEEYLGRTRDSRIYTLAMVINPALKLSWTDTSPRKIDPTGKVIPKSAFGNEESEKFREAKGWILEEMMKFQTERR
ncbi:ribonuclease H-like domain-containing protein, partial [Ephemerocybe angulata]